MSQSRPAFGNAMLSVAGRAPAAQPAPAPAQVVGVPAWGGMPMTAPPWAMAYPPMWTGEVGQPAMPPGMNAPLPGNMLPGPMPPADSEARGDVDARFASLLRTLGTLGPNESQMLAAIASFVGETFGAGSQSGKAVMEWAARLDSRPRMNYERGPVAPPAEQAPASAGGFRPFVLGRAS